MESTLTKILNVPLNRTEGDLEIKVEIDDNTVIDSWSSGIMFRGIENLMIGRGPMDGLVITPRICGICSTSHLTAAAKALDSICNIEPPPNAVRIRNLALMTEHIQSDMRHAFLMFMADFVNSAYKDLPMYDEAVKRYAPLKGETVVDVVNQSRAVLEIVAIVGGQWPHSSYMVPGGIATTPSSNDFLQCRFLLDRYREWYERRVLGCGIDLWRNVKSSEDLETWLTQSPSHSDSELGFFIRYARAIGLDKIGHGPGNFISYGQLDLPEDTRVHSRNSRGKHLIPGGFARITATQPFYQKHVTEHVAHSWYENYEGGKHPFEGKTVPYATGDEGGKYSWIKAPRYKGFPAETGPLAEMIVSENPLFVDLVEKQGPNVFVRELARLVRPAILMPAMAEWIMDMDPDGEFYRPTRKIMDGTGFGCTQASRGALGHWIKIEDGKIKRYQIITPTAWNGSPRDSDDVRGPWEEALVGTPVRDMQNPIELGHVVRSFDPCLVCAVHAIKGPKSLFRKRL